MGLKIEKNLEALQRVKSMLCKAITGCEEGRRQFWTRLTTDDIQNVTQEQLGKLPSWAIEMVNKETGRLLRAWAVEKALREEKLKGHRPLTISWLCKQSSYSCTFSHAVWSLDLFKVGY